MLLLHPVAFVEIVYEDEVKEELRIAAKPPPPDTQGPERVVAVVYRHELDVDDDDDEGQSGGCD